MKISKVFAAMNCYSSAATGESSEGIKAMLAGAAFAFRKKD